MSHDNQSFSVRQRETPARLRRVVSSWWGGSAELLCEQGKLDCTNCSARRGAGGGEKSNDEGLMTKECLSPNAKEEKALWTSNFSTAKCGNKYQITAR